MWFLLLSKKEQIDVKNLTQEMRKKKPHKTNQR